MDELEQGSPVEASFSPQLAEEYLLLLRGGPHSLRYSNHLTPEEKERGEALLDEIVAQAPELNRESLSRMLFDSPEGKPVPGEKRVFFGNFDFAMVASNWVRPPEGFLDQLAPYRKLMEEHYLVGELEKKFLLLGDERIEEHHPSPSNFYYAQPTESKAA